MMEYVRDWCLYSRRDPRFALKGDGPLTFATLLEAVKGLEADIGCRMPDDLTVYKYVGMENGEEECE